MRGAVCLAAALALVSGCGADRRPDNGEPWKEVSGTKALAHVQALVDFGPRPPGSEAIEKSRGYIIAQLEGFGWKVERQAFEGDTPRGKTQFVNLIATFGAHASPEFLVCSHYDTKTFDSGVFVGANDGGSSAGLLIELARVFGSRRVLAEKLQLVFFDGEEAYESFTDTDGLYGSRHFAAELTRTGKARRFRGGVLLDMIGDRSLDVTLPPDSPPGFAAGIFESADALKLRKYFTYSTGGILDDHTPLNAAGIPTIDLIDFDYDAWHTLGDTMDKISADSLGIVGAVTAHFVASRVK